MGEGRKDYSAGIMSEGSTAGRDMVFFIENGGIALAGDAIGTCYEYIVPIGKRLWIGRIDITTNSTAFNDAYIQITGFGDIMIWFESLYTYVFAEVGCCKLNAGDEIKVWVGNRDNIERDFFGTLVGFLESIIA